MHTYVPSYLYAYFVKKNWTLELSTMANRFPRPAQGIRPTENQIPTIMGAVNMPPTMSMMQQQPGMMPSAFHAVPPGSWVNQQPMMQGGFVGANMMPGVGMVSPATSSGTAAGNKDRNYLQQQQKLRAMASSFKKPGPLSADSLIEDLLQQKETFSMCVPQFPVAQAGTVPVQTGKVKAYNVHKLWFAGPTVQNNKKVNPGMVCGVGMTPSMPGGVPMTPTMAGGVAMTPTMASGMNPTIPSGIGMTPTISGGVAMNQAMPGGVNMTPSMHATGSTPSATMPLWLSPEAFDLLPAVYRKVWELTKIPAADGREFVDTSKIFSILLTSGLPRDALGYIWNLANNGIPGVLSHCELNVALALVALAQSGWRNFTSTAILSMTPQPPVPTLQFESVVPPAAQDPVTPQPSMPFQDLTFPTSILSPSQSQQQQPVTNPIQVTNSSPPVEVKQQTSILDDNDDFSDFQSAPTTVQTLKPVEASQSFFSPRDSPLGFNSFESPPVSPVLMKPKGSREVGSRLANYSFGAPSSNSSQTSKQSLSDSTEDIPASVNKSDDNLFPKCAIKPPQQDTHQSSASTLMFIKDSITQISSGKDTEEPTPAISNTSTNEDKYSALRFLDDLGSLDEDKPIATPTIPTMPTSLPVLPPVTSTVDDFGDFLSAGPSVEDDSFAEISKREKPSQVPTLPSPIPTVQVSNSEPDAWNANFDDFVSASGSQWRDQNNSVPPPLESNTGEVEDDEDFGDFVGPSTTTSLPQLNRLKEGLNKTPDTQSVASLELGGFDSLSLGGGGPASSPEGGLSELRSALEGVQWDVASAALQEEGQEWRQCLQGCLALLQAAARILGAIEDPHVADEVVSSREGEDYLANLLEVYCVTQRISAASHQLLPACRLTLEPLLAEVEVAWQVLMPFLERSSIEVHRDRKWNVSADNSAQCCALCLVLVEDAEGNTGIVKSGQHSYHASCANLWVNCVSASLPAISVP
ncbi:hypothetical protein B566_EDAN017285 [Ephemera danica]|nr:hypothetical protein B566_EDAN017285 [Ephemera danica]